MVYAKGVIKLRIFRKDGYPGLSGWALNVFTCVLIRQRHKEFWNNYTEEKTHRRLQRDCENRASVVTRS